MNQMEKLISICKHNLNSSKSCLDYLKNRGVGKDLINEYGIGYFPQNISTLSNYVDLNILRQKNIVRINNDSDFKNYHYLVIPIYDEYGIIHGISGRSLMSSNELKLLGIPKYKNSSYSKSKILFGFNKALDSIIKKRSVWIVEGYFDQISMFQHGGKNCVAMGGTAFSKSHLVKLKRYCNKINFLYDSDEAGFVSSQRVYKKFNKFDIDLNFYAVKDYKDIDEYLFNKKSLRFLKQDIKKLNFGEI